ncbi:hypothetical protein [Corynebacterium parakroppenstedtii]|nr:hypothetical protein [Corynebacterium parakroppenstedtii]
MDWSLRVGDASRHHAGGGGVLDRENTITLWPTVCRRSVGANGA